MRVWWQSSTPLDRPAMADYRSHLVAHVASVKRELVDIPIVSFGETTIHVACMLGDRVSGVAFSDKQAGRYTRQAAAMGLRDRVA